MRNSPAPLAAELAEELRRCHGCHTVILFGSRARADQNSLGLDSDFDLFGIRESGGPCRDLRNYKGVALDAFICDEETLASESARFLLRLRDGLVLLERVDLGRQIIERVRQTIAAGPPPMASAEVDTMRAWAHKMLGRIAQGNNVYAHYRRVELLNELLERYFELRGKWYFGPKESFAWLLIHDQPAHAAFTDALRPGAELRAIEHLVAVVVDQPQ